MAHQYPAQIDNLITLPKLTDLLSGVNAESVNKIRDALISIEVELGANPSGTYGTVKSRLDALEVAIISGGIVFGGDLFPTSPSSQTVVGIQGVEVDIAAPVQSAVPVYDNADVRYNIRKLSLDDIDPAFLINSFSGGSNVEVGDTVTNPSFSATYSKLATSASITNTESIDSPKVLSSPYTSGTVTGAFTKNTVNASIVFTLTAIGTATKNATSNINFYARSFVGVGTAGATSATASGSTAVLVGASGTLSSHGIFSNVVGTTAAQQNPSGEKIYFLCPHTTTPHTFKDTITGFGFSMQSPVVFNFTNQYGVIISMDLYESTLVLSTPFTIKIET